RSFSNRSDHGRRGLASIYLPYAPARGAVGLQVWFSAAARPGIRGLRVKEDDNPPGEPPRTAVLDAWAEVAIYRQFRDVSGGETVLLIFHWLGSARLADRMLAAIELKQLCQAM